MAKQMTININGKDYTEADLSDQQKHLLNHLLNLNQKIQSTAFQLEQLQGGRAFFMAQIEASLNDPPKQ